MFHPIDTITPEKLRELMNSYGSSRRPFVWGIDYGLRRGFFSTGPTKRAAYSGRWAIPATAPACIMSPPPALHHSPADGRRICRDVCPRPRRTHARRLLPGQPHGTHARGVRHHAQGCLSRLARTLQTPAWRRVCMLLTRTVCRHRPRPHIHLPHEGHHRRLAPRRRRDIA